MAYNFFLDSDVILDFLMERQPWYENSRELFEKKLKGDAGIYTTAAIILNVQYISQKIIGKAKAILLIQKLLSLLDICIISKDTIIKAYNSPFADIEDAVQYYSAAGDKSVDFFVTRNAKDYRPADEHLKVITPAEAIKILS
jgi:predicted nucleic acid-binding protein